MLFQTILTAFVIIFIGLFFYTWYRLRKQIYIKIPVGKNTPEEFHLPAKLEHILNEKKQKIAYWYIPAKENKAVVILVHGYDPLGGGKSMMLYHAKYLYKAGYTTA
jgi:hypothetical protein